MSIYFGDLHNHCNISYGFGDIENALSEAKQHLDFCSVTGHAMWPDMPTNDKRLEYFIDYHKKGFKKLKENWQKTKSIVDSYNTEDFVTFHSYEIHSNEFGDYHVISPNKNIEIKYCRTPLDLFKAIKKDSDVIIVPHHTAYIKGYRGINWDGFDELASPLVEIFSKHGCAFSDTAPYPYYHTMGPRVYEGTAIYGLSLGKKFSFIGSTDHHAGYPGSYGDGRLAVHATKKDRKSIWEALKKGNTYALTGDKIECYFTINGHKMGSKIYESGIRDISLSVKGCDAIEKVTIYKNEKVWKIINPNEEDEDSVGLFKISLEFGWGFSEDIIEWETNIRITNGKIKAIEPCFRGASVLSPEKNIEKNAVINKFGNRLVKKADNNFELFCKTAKNISTLHPQTCLAIVELEGDYNSMLHLNINGKQKKFTLSELVNGSKAFFMNGMASEAVLIHRAVPKNKYMIEYNAQDTAEKDLDYYFCEVQQKNMQFAWVSPIYIMS